MSQDLDRLLTALRGSCTHIIEAIDQYLAAQGSKTKPKPASIQELQRAFPEDLRNLLSFEELEGYVAIKPRRFLGSENFAKVASVIRDLGGEYISAGKQSHFRISKTV